MTQELTDVLEQTITEVKQQQEQLRSMLAHLIELRAENKQLRTLVVKLQAEIELVSKP